MKKTALLLLWLVVGCLVVPGRVWADVEEEPVIIRAPRIGEYPRRQSTVTYDVVFAPEINTFDDFGTSAELEAHLQQYLDSTNDFYINELGDGTAAGTPILFNYLRMDPPFNKTQSTNCQYTIDKWYPDEYCDHGFGYIYVIVDNHDTTYPSARPAAASMRFVRNGGLFVHDEATSNILTHEISHVTGLPDLYPVTIDPGDNAVNGTSYYPFIGDIMMGHGTPNATFTLWSQEVLWRQPDSLPSNWNLWVNDQPQYNYMKFVGSNSCPVAGVDVSVYEAEHGWPAYSLENVVDFCGPTNTYGGVYWNENVLSSNSGLARKIFLLKTEKDGVVNYLWDNFSSMNFAYWAGNITEAAYTYVLPYPGDCSVPSPPPRSTPLPIAEDADKDGDVDFADLLREVQFFACGGQGSMMDDVNGNGQLDGLDYGAVVREIGK